MMLKVPQPTRIPLGTLQVGGQTVELFISPEWARYFASLTDATNEHEDQLTYTQPLPISEAQGDLCLLPAPTPDRDHGLGTVYAPPSTKDAADRGSFPMQWPTQNPRGNGSWADLWVPDQKTFVDKVLSLRNNSRAPDGSIYGLAAICLLDAAGKERGAFGYSRNGAIQPTGYYADTVYVEYGDPFAGDNNPSSFKLICTMAATSPWFPGTSFLAMEADAKSGATTIRARGGQPITLTGGATQTDDANVGGKGNVHRLLGGMTNTNWRIRERDNMDSVAWTTNINDAGVQDDATKPSWKVQHGYGNGDDAFRVARTPSGSSVFADLLKVSQNGNVQLNSTGGVTMLGTAFASSGNGKLQVREAGNEFVIAAKNTASKEWVWGVNANTMYFRNATDATNALFMANGGRVLVGNATDDGTTKLQINGGGIKHGSSTLLSTSVALSDASGTAAGTLSNAPLAGDPTKWISINDNGTIRRIPTW